MSKLSRILALALVFVTVAASAIGATAATYTDSAEKPVKASYQAAVDMLSELNVINGFQDGSFRPDANLTRAQYLKMLYVIQNRGVDNGAGLYGDLPITFTDVARTAWYNGYVRWGVGREILAGKSADLFDPDGNVTGYEALKMALTGLGYNQKLEGFADVGIAWQGNVLNAAQEAGLLENLAVADMSAPLCREEAAHILKNALFAEMVSYNTSFTPAKVEKGTTMAITFFNLDEVKGLLVSNDQAAFEGGVNRKGECTVWMNGDSSRAVTLPYAAPLNLLGQEVSFFAKIRAGSVQNGIVTAYEKVYGQFAATQRNVVKTVHTVASLPVGAADTDKDIAAYVTDKGQLNQPASSLTGLKYVVDYAAASANPQTAVSTGSPIRFLDWNADGKYDYAVAQSLTYAKVTAVADGKITAQVGVAASSAFSGTRIFNGAKIADIAGAEDLKAGDRILVSKIGSQFVAEKVAPQKGTLTASKNNGTTAVIDGKEYAQSELASRVTNFSAVMNAGNFNVEREYYFYNNQIVEATVSAASAKGFALIKDSYIESDLLSETKQVSVLLDDNSQGIYALSGVTGPDGKPAKLTASADSKIEIGGTVLAPNAILQYALSDDGKTISLFVPSYDNQTAAAPDSLSALTYSKGAAATGGTKKTVLDSTVFFVMNHKTGATFAAYRNRTMPTFAQSDLTADVQALYGDLKGSLNAEGDAIRAAFITTQTLTTATASRSFAIVLDKPVIAIGESGKYFASMTIFDGAAVKTVSVKDGVAAGSDLNSEKTGLSADNFGVSQGDIIDCTLSGEKIDRLMVIAQADSDSPSNLPDSELFKGYYDFADQGSLRFYHADRTANQNSELLAASGAKFYEVNLANGTAAEMSGLTEAETAYAPYVIVRVDNNRNATHVWLLTDKDTADMTPPVVTNP